MFGAPRAFDRCSTVSRGRPQEETFRSDDVAARKLARELSGLVLEIVVEADGAGLVVDFGGMEELSFFEECFETDGHGGRIEEG